MIKSSLTAVSELIILFQTRSIFNVLEMCYGIIFQEYHQSRMNNKGRLITLVTFMWVAATTFLSMAFTGNLKSSLVRKNYEERTMTLNEIVDKDLTIHMSNTMENYLDSDISDLV